MLNLDLLNDSQKKAVLDTEGAVLVFAGAGSGKTRVLTYRVAYLIEKGVSPWNILAITFTNKATNEMKERLYAMLGEDYKPWIDTFHKLCSAILRIHAQKIGYDRNFSIFDTIASERIIKRVLREKHMDEKKYKSKILHHISTAKNMGLDSDNYFDYIRLKNRDAMDIVECYDRYQQILLENNAMDFDDLLFNAIKLFKEHPDVLEYYQNRFQYIHIDEFQDTNQVQMELARMLSLKWGNIFVVGDDDQSIYGWRGANIDNILDFEKSFKNAKVYKLMQNYRSTQEILCTANNVIRHNSSRKEKMLFTDSEKGLKTEFNIAFNDHSEAEWVLENIRALKYHNDYKNSDFAILVRTNALTRQFEIKLKQAGIPYCVYGGYKFFDRQEIQDILAYMRVLVNPKDAEALTRIINFPRRGIGDSTIDILVDYCNKAEKPLFDAVMDINSNKDLSSAVKNKISAFKEVLDDLLSAKQSLDLYEFIKYLLEKLELEKYYNEKNKEEDINRWENSLELVSHIKEQTKTNPSLTMEEFLQTITLESDVQEEDTDKLIVGTMHSVKGLEFRAVFIAGCEEGVFPSSLSMNEENGVEEERRVMYVAITRAKERLFISCAQNRFRFNSVQSLIPSRFIYEAMGEQKTPESQPARMGRRFESIKYETAFPSTPSTPTYNPKPQIQGKREKVYNKDTKGFVAGAKITHKKYGEGTILVVTGEGMSKTATIAFEGLGIKKFALANAPIALK